VVSANALYLGAHVQTIAPVPIATLDGYRNEHVHGYVIELGADSVRVKSPDWPIAFRFAYHDLTPLP
jgi:hypothetical protein